MKRGEINSITCRAGIEGVEVYLYSFFNFFARWVGWLTPHPGGFTAGSDAVPMLKEAVWTAAENQASTRIRSPDQALCNDNIVVFK